MIIRHMRVFAYLLFTCIFLNGCSLTHEVEIRKYSVEHVQRSNIGSVIGEDVDLPLIKNLKSDDFIVFQLESNEDLLSLAKKMGSSLYSDAYFCEEPEQQVLLIMPGIYSGSKSVTMLSIQDGERHKNDEESHQAWYRYEVVLFASWEADREAPRQHSETEKTYYLKYDLIKEPKDICVSISGGNMVQIIKSNTLTIMAEEIRRVLE